MYQIELKNCNSIKEGKIQIEANKLNIKYGINGTGKTTIAKALKLHDNNLQELKSYLSSEPASVSIQPQFNKIIVFDEDFVNQIVFKEDEVIGNSFEVFLKSPNYDLKKELIESKLSELHKISTSDQEIIEIKQILEKVNGKFKWTNSGNISKTGTFKSLLSKQNIYNIPEELSGYKTFFNNTDINISWIEWKNRGDDYDIGEMCPYCTENINRQAHNKRKEIFKSTYSKTDSQNLKEMLDILESLKDYINNEKYITLISYIKEDTTEDVITTIIKKLLLEVRLLLNRFYAIEDFGRRKLAIADISKIEKGINEMSIPEDMFEIFLSEKSKNIFKKVNKRVNELRREIKFLQSELGKLKGIINATIKKSQEDINMFLKTAGINYEFVIDAEDEFNSRTILKQCFTEDKTTVSNIRKHLSWGERNAFALILFMYYAKTKKPDLIILDDPISSFDSHKKYAILHRMFKNIGKRKISFAGQTVLLLTHDFEPIIDFLVLGKLNSDEAVASYIWNESGNIKEKSISIMDDIKLLTIECAEIASNKSINIINRITFLRKLCELNGCKDSWDYAYQILSCLIHATEIKRKIGNENFIDMNANEINIGLTKIKQYIPDFDYNVLKDSVYNFKAIKQIYLEEDNGYLKMQQFRAMKEVSINGKINISPMDTAWFKFIDETYHIENDYLYYLDILKFNIVPNYILMKVDELISKL